MTWRGRDDDAAMHARNARACGVTTGRAGRAARGIDRSRGRGDASRTRRPPEPASRAFVWRIDARRCDALAVRRSTFDGRAAAACQPR
ncbi:hypothetical protein WS82_27105 [Burkholderia sp. MSMB2041]|nr:hypothetical protein WS78_14180 [Burkholderia savannae]KVG41710.1 hypothetical protein WS77_16740 [Burkholderia sp. MSMB0265]KVG98364.1 hypothetical protein WS82_27105 [Burkholderia sp. MSMB2041]